VRTIKIRAYNERVKSNLINVILLKMLLSVERYLAIVMKICVEQRKEDEGGES